MKALVKDGDVLRETAWSPFVKAHLDWMQSSEGYVLVQDYVPATEDEEAAYTVVEEATATEEKTYTIGGKTYTESELAKLVNN